MRKLILNIFALLVSLTLAGCASEPAVPSKQAADKILSGEQMLRDSQGIAQLGSRWQDGKQMVERGQAMQREGQLKIDEGRNLVEEGQKVMRESEEGYKNIKQ